MGRWFTVLLLWMALGRRMQDLGIRGVQDQGSEDRDLGRVSSGVIEVPTEVSVGSEPWLRMAMGADPEEFRQEIPLLSRRSSCREVVLEETAVVQEGEEHVPLCLGPAKESRDVLQAAETPIRGCESDQSPSLVPEVGLKSLSLEEGLSGDGDLLQGQTPDTDHGGVRTPRRAEVLGEEDLEERTLIRETVPGISPASEGSLGYLAAPLHEPDLLDLAFQDQLLESETDLIQETSGLGILEMDPG